MRSRNIVYLCAIGVILSGCGTKPIKPADQHIQRPTTQPETENSIPQPIKGSVVLPPPKPADKVATYSVVVTNVPAQEILFALARDAKINLDIQSGIQGTVTVNAINQTLPQILTRIARQVDMRYELNNGTLTVMPDKPFLRTYKIDFINMSRSAKSTNSTSSQIATNSTSASAAATGAEGGNSASTIVTSETKNDLMESLIKNITDIILDEDKLHYQEKMELQSANQASARGTGSAFNSSSFAAQKGNGGTEINQASDGGKINRGNPGTGGSVSGSSDQDVRGQGTVTAAKAVYERAVNVFANKETGVLIVRATSRQHEKVQEFIDRVMSTAKRQVLIEATIVEVTLSDQYQQGINWSRLLLGTKGFTLSQTGAVGIAATTGALAVSYINPTSKFGNIAASVQLLEQFGNVKVLSSPQLSVMNNQTASLKVADNNVYFTITSTPATFGTAGTVISPAIYTTTPNSVSVGLTMSVTPQISDTDTVTINVRPSISRIISYASDPNPSLANPCGTGVNGCTIPAIHNLIPQIQTREMESIIKVDSGQTVVMGGLIQEGINKQTSEIPLLGRIPILGNLFQNRNDTTTKTELVIFLRPVVIKDASVNGDFSEFRNNLPDQNFFKESASGKP
jgi:general secretion pathway protein D